MKQFKPFDKILVKDSTHLYWRADILSHIDYKSRYVTINGVIYREALPFEGNEHLLGTDNEPEEEITLKKGERIVCSDSINRLLNGYGTIETFSRVVNDVIDDSEGCPWKYCIPYSQFKEKNSEHDILCVINGKFVRYESVL